MIASATTTAAATSPTSSTRTTPCRMRRRFLTGLPCSCSSSTKVARKSEPVMTWCPCRTVTSFGFLAIYHQHTRVDRCALVQRGPNGAVQAVFQVKDAAVLHHVRKQVSEERRVLRQQRLEVK